MVTAVNTPPITIISVLTSHFVPTHTHRENMAQVIKYLNYPLNLCLRLVDYEHDLRSKEEEGFHVGSIIFAEVNQPQIISQGRDL